MSAIMQDRQTAPGLNTGCGWGWGKPRLSATFAPSPHSHSLRGAGYGARKGKPWDGWFSIVSFRCREPFPSLFSPCELRAELLNPTQSGGTPPLDKNVKTSQ